MGLYQNFPYTNLHELNLDWLIEQLNKISSSSVLSVNGQTGQVILYENATVNLPAVPEDSWTIVRMADGTTRGIYFGADDKAYIVHGATLEAVYSANNQPPYPVTRVNGQTGDITLYQDQYVQLPSLSDLNMHNWTLFRNLNNMAEGIQFGEDGSAYIIHGTYRYLIYTSHDSPQGIVDSVNGQSGTVVLFTDSQGDITFPAYTNEDFAGWILKRNINGTLLGIGFNEDGTLEFKCGGASYKIYTANDPQEGYVSDPTASLQEVTEDSASDYWGLLRNTSEGQVGLIFENTNPDTPSVSLAYTDSNDQQQVVQLVTFDDIPASSVISVNTKSGIVVLTGEDIKVSTTDTRTLDTAFNDTKEMIAHVENTDTASDNIPAGAYVIWHNDIYVASQAISLGDTLSGSNLTQLPTEGIANDLHDRIARMINTSSLIIKTNATSTNTEVSTYGGRKFSDYLYLHFLLYNSASDYSRIRNAITIPAVSWTSGRTLQLMANHGASFENISGILVSYESDTSVKIKLEGAEALTGIEIIGERK